MSQTYEDSPAIITMCCYWSVFVFVC